MEKKRFISVNDTKTESNTVPKVESFMEKDVTIQVSVNVPEFTGLKIHEELGYRC